MYIKGVPSLNLQVADLSRTAKPAKIVEAQLNNGMITTIDPADIPNSALQLAFNCLVRYDKTLRRPGTDLLFPTKPNSFPVIRIAFFKTQDGAPYTIRFTPSTIHTRSELNWTPIVISPTLIGGVNDRISTANVLNSSDGTERFIFTNNGLNPIQVIDFVAGTCGPLGNAPNARYVVGFFNRAVGLAIKDTSEVTVAWSADGDPTEWNPATDPTAGSSPIIEAPGDLSDFIKGAISFSNVMIMLREHSVWLVNKQPIPTNPFYFYSAVPGIGTDCPYSLEVINNGIAFLDTQTKDVYGYTPGNPPEGLSLPVRKALFDDIGDPGEVFSAFNKTENEYSIYIPKDGNVTRVWTYNFITKSWAQQEMYGVTAAENVALSTAFTTIDELLGTIDDLSGTIDSLSKVFSISIPFSYGRNDGTITTENVDTDHEAPHADFPNGIVFTSQLVSKQFNLPEEQLTINKINIEYQASRSTTLILDISTDNGNTWINMKSFTINKLDKPTLFTLRKLIRARRFQWRLSFNSSDIEILGYEVYALDAGVANQND